MSIVHPEVRFKRLSCFANSDSLGFGHSNVFFVMEVLRDVMYVPILTCACEGEGSTVGLVAHRMYVVSLAS